MNAKDYMAHAHTLRCVVCDTVFGKKTMPVQFHHLQSVRDKYSDWAGIPICFEHHAELHRLSRRAFARQYRLDDIDLLKHTIRLLMEDK